MFAKTGPSDEHMNTWRFVNNIDLHMGVRSFSVWSRAIGEISTQSVLRVLSMETGTHRIIGTEGRLVANSNTENSGTLCRSFRKFILCSTVSQEIEVTA